MSESPISSRTILWHRILDHQSMEEMSLSRGAESYRLRGSVTAAHEGKPLRIAYEIVCDRGWRTQLCAIEQVFGGERRMLFLQNEEGHWRVNGHRDEALEGCLDVDLGLSPSTNTLAINRLKLAVSETRDIKAAWVKFPALSVTPAPQSYQRLGDASYLYRGWDSDFKAMLDVDDAGLVRNYEGIWQAIATVEGTTDGGPPSSLSFAHALISAGPSPDLGPHGADLDWLVGCWSAVVREHADDGAVLHGTGEWWFSWVLEGRALQDVWISPERVLRGSPPPDNAGGNRYGTTIRNFDVRKGKWCIYWVNPVTGARNVLEGGRHGDRILLEGAADGRAIRWSLNDITATRFLWRGEHLDDNGRWKLDAEFELTRRF